LLLLLPPPPAAGGGCEAIPQGPGCNSPRACAAAYPCTVRQGLLFVRPVVLPNAFLAKGSQAAVDTSTVPIVEELDQEGWVTQVGAGRLAGLLRRGWRPLAPGQVRQLAGRAGWAGDGAEGSWRIAKWASAVRLWGAHGRECSHMHAY
jgi:hypothetical protein